MIEAVKGCPINQLNRAICDLIHTWKPFCDTREGLDPTDKCRVWREPMEESRALKHAQFIGAFLQQNHKRREEKMQHVREVVRANGGGLMKNSPLRSQ